MTSPSDDRPQGDDVKAAGADSPGRHSRRLFWLAVLAVPVVLLAVYGLWRWGASAGAFFQDQEKVREWIAQFGALGPLISILLNTLQVLLAPIPGQVVGLANGYLYGVFLGTVFSLIGVMLGTAIAMLLGRVLGRPVVERLVSPEHLDQWDALSTKRGPIFLFLVFLLPLLPDDIVAFAVGLSPISIPYALLLAAIGRLPGLIVSSWVGANATSLSPIGWGIVGLGTLTLAVGVLRYRDRLEDAMLRLVDKLSGVGSAAA
jgi:uncharacterized membrane protein YdjX (TVP38/TMEM64 family)